MDSRRTDLKTRLLRLLAAGAASVAVATAAVLSQATTETPSEGQQAPTEELSLEQRIESLRQTLGNNGNLTNPMPGEDQYAWGNWHNWRNGWPNGWRNWHNWGNW